MKKNDKKLILKKLESIKENQKGELQGGFISFSKKFMRIGMGPVNPNCKMCHTHNKQCHVGCGSLG